MAADYPAHADTWPPVGLPFPLMVSEHLAAHRAPEQMEG